MAGHVPGAVFVDLDHDLSGSGGPGRHPLPDIAEFAASLGRLGVGGDDEVVVYDDVSGTIAARLWWMLRSIGHGKVRLLDGGFTTWSNEGRPIERGPVDPTPAVYPAPEGFAGVVLIDHLDGRTILDARSGERYRGEFEPVDPKAGHIPGALSVPTDANLTSQGRFKSAEELDSQYRGFVDPVISCGSGVSACHDALAMVAAGLPMPGIYIGSFSEWSRLDRPVTTGPEP